MQALNTSYHTDNSFVYKTASLDFDGTVLPMPAGDLRLAAGFQYQGQEADFSSDYIVHAEAPLYIKCLISEEACTGEQLVLVAAGGEHLQFSTSEPSSLLLT